MSKIKILILLFVFLSCIVSVSAVTNITQALCADDKSFLIYWNYNDNMGQQFNISVGNYTNITVGVYQDSLLGTPNGVYWMTLCDAFGNRTPKLENGYCMNSTETKNTVTAMTLGAQENFTFPNYIINETKNYAWFVGTTDSVVDTGRYYALEWTAADCYPNGIWFRRTIATGAWQLGVAGSKDFKFIMYGQPYTYPSGPTNFLTDIYVLNKSVNFTSDGSQICGYNGSVYSLCGPTEDMTPTFKFTTAGAASCKLWNASVNYTTIGAQSNCSTTGTTSHICTFPINLFPSNWNETKQLYISCQSGTFEMNNWVGANANVMNITIKDIYNPKNKFNEQVPADVTTTNIIGNPLNITYNMSDTFSGINTSESKLFFKVNTTTSDCFGMLNGTIEYCGYRNVTFLSNVSRVFLSRLYDNFIYPGIYNWPETQMELLPHQTYTLNNPLIRYYMNFINVSLKNVSIFEINANCSGAVMTLAYYNSSNSTFDFCTINSGQVFNHRHTNNSAHMLCSVPYNTTTGLLGTVKVTPFSGVVARIAGSGACYIYEISNVTAIGRMQESSNGGVTITPRSATADSHWHTFDGTETIFYYACARDISGKQNCTTNDIKTEQIQSGGLPPTPPIVFSPTATYYRNVTINWTSCFSPNSYPIVQYNVSVLYTNFTLFRNIRANNSVNLSYVWQTNSSDSGQWVVEVQCCDNNSLCDYGESAEFFVDNLIPNVKFIPNSPMNDSFQNTTFVWNISLQNYNVTNLSVHLTNGTNIILSYHNASIKNASIVSGTFDVSSLRQIRHYLYATGCDGVNLCNETESYTLNVGSPYPGIPQIISPTDPRVYGFVWINYTNVSTYGNIAFFNITLYYSSNNTPITIRSNNSLNLTYYWNSSVVIDSSFVGTYYIGITIKNTYNYTATGYSINFSVDNEVPIILFVVHPDLNVNLSENYAPNWSVVYSQLNWSSPIVQAGNFTLNFTEHNMSTLNITSYTINVSSTNNHSGAFYFLINHTQPWFNFYCNNILINTSYQSLATVSLSNNYSVINCTLSLINASQKYVDWILSIDKANWAFTYNYTAY